MIRIFRKYFYLICLFLTSCSLVPTELKTAEQLIESKPDSALQILQHINPKNLKSESNRALYGLLLFQALDNNYKLLTPDSVIDFSINYYTKHNDIQHLNACYFLKAHALKSLNLFELAFPLYLKVLDYSLNKKKIATLGKVYADIADIYSIQFNYDKALIKYKLSLENYNRVGNKNQVYLRMIDIGRTYCFKKRFRIAQLYFDKTLALTKDSMLVGRAFTQIGNNYYSMHQLDSGEYYLRKSLKYPYSGTNYAVRCFILSDLLFDIGQYDSAFHYASRSIQHKANIYAQRECYRILVNVEYLKHDIKEANRYIQHYQACVDSIRKIEAQTKIAVLENLNEKSHEANETKRNMVLTVLCLSLTLIISFLIVYFFYSRSKQKNNQLDLIKSDLKKGQLFVSNKLSKEIALAKELQTEIRKDITTEERIILDKELYNKILHLNDWSAFRQEMNHAFNQLVDRLDTDYPTITQKEITWCCLELLDISQSDRILLLDATPDSLYKLKQRIAQKMNLDSTKELGGMLKELIVVKNDLE